MKLLTLASSLSLFLFSTLALAAPCDFTFKKEKLCAALHWVKEPKAVEMPTEKDKAEFTLEFKSTQGQKDRVDLVQKLSVSIFMPGMDHGSMPVQIVHSEKGIYRVQNVFFTMGGDWDINVKLLDAKDAKKIRDQAKMHYTVKE